MEFSQSSYKIGDLFGAILSKRRNRSMEELPQISNDNKSLQVRKPWYYHDRSIPILNCGCAYHKKRMLPQQYIEYQYNHSKGCHNEMIRVHRVNIHNEVKDRTKQLLKIQYNRRDIDLKNKRQKIKEVREYQSNKIFLRKHIRTPSDSMAKTRYSRQNSKQYTGNLHPTNSDTINFSRCKRKYIGKQTMMTQQEQQNQNCDQNLLQQLSGKKMSLKNSQQMIKQIMSDSTAKHHSTFLNLRRRGYKFECFPDVIKYLKCIQNEFKIMAQDKGCQGIDNNIFIRRTQKKLIDEFEQINGQMALKLIRSWMQKQAIPLLKQLKRQSKYSEQLKQQSRNELSQRRTSKVNSKRSTMGAFYQTNYNTYGKKISEQNQRDSRQIRENKDILKSHIEYSKMSRRQSVANKLSTNITPNITSTFIKGNRDDKQITKSSISRIGISSKLKPFGIEYSKKKKPQNNNKRKSVFREQRPQSYISGTNIASGTPSERVTRISQLKEEEEVLSKKYSKNFTPKRRLTRFKNANSKLLMTNQRSQLLKQLTGFRQTKHDINYTTESMSNFYENHMRSRDRSTHQIIDPNQLNIGHMVIKGNKKIGKRIHMDEFALNQDQQKDDELSEDDTKKNEQILKQIRLLRKKRIKMNLINQILFGECGKQQELSLSDIQDYGSSTQLKQQQRDLNRKRYSEQIFPRHASARFPNGPKSPLVKFYDLKRDDVEDGIIDSINQLLMKSKLSHFCINLGDSNRIRSRKLKKLKSYLINHPQIKAKDLERNIKLYQQHQKLTKAAKVATKLNYDPQLLLTIDIPDDTIIKAILNMQSKKTSDPGFGYQLIETDPHQSSCSSLSLSGQQIDIKQKIKENVIPKLQLLNFNLFNPAPFQQLLQKGLIQHSNASNYFILDHYFKQSLLQLKSKNPDILKLTTDKVISQLIKQR